jgi:hypothetical protein
MLRLFLFRKDTLSMKFTFKKEDGKGEATIVFNSESLEEVVAEFEKFLRATGFDLGENKFALVNFAEMEAMLEEEFMKDLEDEYEDDEEDKGSGNGSSGSGDNGKH